MKEETDQKVVCAIWSFPRLFIFVVCAGVGEEPQKQKKCFYTLSDLDVVWHNIMREVLDMLAFPSALKIKFQ